MSKRNYVRCAAGGEESASGPKGGLIGDASCQLFQDPCHHSGPDMEEGKEKPQKKPQPILD